MKYKILIVGYDFRLKEYRYNQPVETPEGYFLNSSADVLFTLTIFWLFDWFIFLYLHYIYLGYFYKRGALIYEELGYLI